jgi:hypothetical protein
MAGKNWSTGGRSGRETKCFEEPVTAHHCRGNNSLVDHHLFVYQGTGRSKCDSIFEQTADRLRGNLEFINIKGGLALGREKVQELTEGSQKVALHLKTCCIAQQAGSINADQFQLCISGAKDYETRCGVQDG